MFVCRVALVALATFLLTPTAARSAPCCGGSAVSTALMAGETRAQFTTRYLFQHVVGDALPDSTYYFRSSDNVEEQHSFVLEGAYLISDRWQLMGSFPILYRRRVLSDMEETHVGLGDLGLGAAFEVLPEWNYSRWRPHGFIFGQFIAPMGKGSPESASGLGADTFSRGFFMLSVGGLFLKSWNNWDASISVEFHQPFPRSFDLPDVGASVKLTPLPGGSVSVSGGYTFTSIGLRLGLAVSPIIDGPVMYDSPSLPDTSTQVVWNTSLQAAYSINGGWAISGVYTDQTFLGPAKNVTLSRFVGLSIQKSWER